jgi:hypothetical protein
MTPSQKGQLIRELLETIAVAVEQPTTQQRLRVEDTITLAATKLDNEDKKYLSGWLGGIGSDFAMRQDELTPRDLFLRNVKDMWRR